MCHFRLNIKIFVPRSPIAIRNSFMKLRRFSATLGRTCRHAQCAFYRLSLHIFLHSKLVETSVFTFTYRYTEKLKLKEIFTNQSFRFLFKLILAIKIFHLNHPSPQKNDQVLVFLQIFYS